MKKDTVKEKTTANSLKKDKKTTKKGNSQKKQSTPKAKVVSKTIKNEKTAKKPIKIPVENKTNEKKAVNTKTALKTAKTEISPVKKSPVKPTEHKLNKPPSESQDMSLPEGSALKQTGHRRPLIVFPK